MLFAGFVGHTFSLLKRIQTHSVTYVHNDRNIYITPSDLIKIRYIIYQHVNTIHTGIYIKLDDYTNIEMEIN